MVELGLVLVSAEVVAPVWAVDRACELVAAARPELVADQGEVPAAFVAPELVVVVVAAPASVLKVASGYSSNLCCDYSRHSSFQKIKHLAVCFYPEQKSKF